jgi:hypothetical protein
MKIKKMCPKEDVFSVTYPITWWQDMQEPVLHGNQWRIATIIYPTTYVPNFWSYAHAELISDYLVARKELPQSSQGQWTIEVRLTSLTCKVRITMGASGSCTTRTI